MGLLPNESALELALGEALVLAFADSDDVAAPVAPGSIYFSPTDDPQAPRPAVRIYEASQVDLGRDTIAPVKQLQQWRLSVLAVAQEPYTVKVRGTTHAYDAQPGDDAEDIVTGLVAAIAGDANATAAPGTMPEQMLLTALTAGVALQVETSANLGREIVRDRARWQGAVPAERVYSFQIATVMDPASPSPRQHALTYARLLRGRMWHSDVLARLAAAGASPRRIASGPIRFDVLVDTFTETRASLEVVFSITTGAASSVPVMESASISTLTE